ncbi:DUF2802 domain-containing protein [Vulcanibacillus modesticaldus]|nr:DUF2802 domain-containing protein [Vulcanibacillus modesticaldus]
MQVGLLTVGIIFIIIALFKPKNDGISEDKIEKMFEDFLLQIEIENEEILKKIKLTHTEIYSQLEKELRTLEKRVTEIESRLVTSEATSTGSYITPNDENSYQLNAKYEEVLKLYNSGYSIDEVAQKTNISHAEIKLILGLKQKGYKNV